MKGLPVRVEVERLTYYRSATPGEVEAGNGCTHYRDFTIEEACHPGTRLPKKWLVADDGLRYYRR
jgi:hypothetical protein